MPNGNRPSIYDSLRPLLDARELVIRLGLEVVEESGPELYCRPLCHESTSGSSLHINTDTGVWLCRACEPSGVYGDLFDLVEYAQTGGQPPTRGDGGLHVPSRREAIRWLAQEYGLPFDERTIFADPSLDAVHMVAQAANRALMGNPGVLDWILEKWGFDRGVVEQYGIGFLSDELMMRLSAEGQRNPQIRGALASSGVGWFDRSSGAFRSGFAGRVTFPYLEAGRAVYLIGRETPWTPKRDDGRRGAKYRKLPVHDPKKRPGISPTITNEHLFNEQALRGGGTVLIAEGIADAVALSSIGVPVISPVTVSVNRVDIERIETRALEHGIDGFEILFDNELSGIGMAGALRTAEALMRRGFPVRILELPLGPKEEAARDEVLGELGEEPFARLETLPPVERKKLLEELVPDPDRREWLRQAIESAKVDVAEWYAREGVAAAEAFRGIQGRGVDAFALLADRGTRELDPAAMPATRLRQLSELIELAAHLRTLPDRRRAAAILAQRVGRGLTKRDLESAIAAARRDKVAPAKKAEAEGAAAQERASLPPLSLGPSAASPAPAALDPMSGAETPARGQGGAQASPFASAEAAQGAPAAPKAPPAPKPSGAAMGLEGELERARRAVQEHLRNRSAERDVGTFVAQVIVERMGWMPFRTSSELVLLRGRQAVAVVPRSGSDFMGIAEEVTGISSMRGFGGTYIDATASALRRMAKPTRSVSWSHVEGGAVFWHLGGTDGEVLRIEPGSITPTTAARERVPVVAGGDFEPIQYQHGARGVGEVYSLLRYTSISDPSRLLLAHWITALPILRAAGCCPILRIEGGSGSGKTRTVDFVGHLVNGGESSAVPTAAAMTSRLSRDMLTVDDNREIAGMTASLRDTILQAAHLGAREKRRAQSDTGVVSERINGALLMNGIEPIFDGKGEMASRIVVIRSDAKYQRSGSPTSDVELMAAVLRVRDAFWSEAAERCAIALELDRVHGNRLGDEIRELMAGSRLGRLSPYLRLMFLVAVAGAPRDRWSELCSGISPAWREALQHVQDRALEQVSLDEVAVLAVSLVFELAAKSKLTDTGVGAKSTGLDGLYVADGGSGVEYLGEVGARRLAALARYAGRELNGPKMVTHDLSAPQLQARLLDGESYLEAAGIEMAVTHSRRSGKPRFTFRRLMRGGPAGDGVEAEGDADGFLQG
jgi:hypothetical protein